MNHLRAIFVLIITLLASMIGAQAAEQPLAFPGADGYAKYITGGRGGKIYYVTSLADCTDDDLVPGTLRWALRTGDDSPRTILFAVSGTIYLNSKLKTNHANVSILGQSAPGGGVCVTGYPMVINNRNYIVRYIRFRAGDIPALEANGNVSYSGLDIENASQVLLDHCSITWSMEECLTMFDNDTTTVQYCIVGEGLYHSYNVKTTGDDSGRSFSMQWGGDHSNMHHVLITNCNGRAPRFNGVREAKAWLPGADGKQYAHDCHIDGDFANNVLYNWGGGHLSYYGGEFYATYFDDAPEGLDPYNHVYMRNNYFRPGPSTQKNGSNYRHFFHPSGDNAKQVGEWYLSGNKFELSSYYAPSGTYWTDASLETVNADNLAGFGTNASALDLSSTYRNKLLTEIPYALSGYQPVSADQAYAEVTHATQGAGANLPRYDEEDQRLIDEAAGRRDGIAPYQGSRATGAAKRPGIIDTPTDVKFKNGYDVVTTAAGNTYTQYYPSLALREGERYAIDSDGDGMPDAYEVAVGLDKLNAEDGKTLANNGYTNLENYLNGLADFSLRNADYQTSATYVAPGLATRPKTVTISFANRDKNVIGAMPAPRTVRNGDVVIFEPTWSCYKEGHTLTGWTDGNMTYNFGTEYRSFVEDVTLYPQMTKNNKNIADRTDDVTFTWNFSLPSAPKLSASANGIYVTRGWIESDSLDVRLSYQGLQLTLPAVQDAIATVTYRNGTMSEYAAMDQTLNITLTSADVRSVELTLPYIFDPTGIDFHAVQVASGKNYELVYGDTLQVDQRPWMHTVGQRRNAYRNCINPLGNDEVEYTSNSLTGTTPLYGFIVGQSHTSTYKLLAYVKDCARVRTYASGSNSAGDQMQLTAIPADGTEKSFAYNLHKLNKSNSYSEYFDLELDPNNQYMLVWSSVGGNDMMIGAIKFYDRTGTGATSGDATVQWSWIGNYSATGQTDPSKAFASAKTQLGDQLYSRMDDSGEDYDVVQIRQHSSTQATSATHLVEFRIAPNGGYQFTPTEVSFKRQFTSQGIGTEGRIDIYFCYGNDEEEYVRQTKSTSSSESVTIKSSTANFAERFRGTTKPFAVRLYLVDIPASEGVNLWDIQVKGTYETVPATKYTFTTTVSPAGSGVVSQSPKGKNFVAESEITLSATAASGYQFMYWMDADGNILSDQAKYVHSKQERDEVITACFKDLSESGIFFPGPYQAIVNNADQLIEALTAAQQYTDRYYIFLRNGDYDFGTKAMTAIPQHTSLIGESRDGVVLHNCPSTQTTKYQDETPVLYIDQNQHDVYMQDLTIRQARDWTDKVSRGQAIAVRQRGKRAIYKNVRIEGVQDTYYINKADATAYFEDCQLAGEVDFIYGDGTAWFAHCDLLPLSARSYITAPNTQAGYMGMVFDHCTIAAHPEAKDNVAGYYLGRPWGDSPAATFLHTTMQVLPAAAGWAGMSSGLTLRLHEYGSVDAQGQPLDLSKRSLAACGAASDSDAPVLDEAAASTYTTEAAFGSWYPEGLAAQAPANHIEADGNTLTWIPYDNDYWYAIVQDGKIIDFTVDPYYTCTEPGTYTIRAANSMGGLGPCSNTVNICPSAIETITHIAAPVDLPCYDLYGRRTSKAGMVIQRGSKQILIRK